jgi:hypothetical protein
MEGRRDSRADGECLGAPEQRSEGIAANRVPRPDRNNQAPSAITGGQSKRPMGPFGGARAGGSFWLGASLPSSPRCSRMRPMTSVSSMLAMILTAPPQCSQRSISMPKARLRCGSSRRVMVNGHE